MKKCQGRALIDPACITYPVQAQGLSEAEKEGSDLMDKKIPITFNSGISFVETVTKMRSESVYKSIFSLF